MLGRLGRACPRLHIISYELLPTTVHKRGASSYNLGRNWSKSRPLCGAKGLGYIQKDRLSSSSRPGLSTAVENESRSIPERNRDPAVEAVLGSSSPEQSDATELTLQLTDEEIEELTGGDTELVKKIKYIQLEHEVYRQEGLNVPSGIKSSHWKELLSLPSPGSRKKYYNFLFLNEMKAQNIKIKKQQKREQRFKELEESGELWGPKEVDNDLSVYGLGRNTLFLRLYDTTVNKFHHNKVIQEMQFGQPLVLDCGYDEFMTHREAKNCAKQIEIMLSQNRTHNQPFDLHLCNAPRNSRVMEALLKINPALYADTHPVNITDKSYLDIFPHKNLIYLSPHARDELEEYNDDEIYIIGAMVDKSDPRPLSMAKAKRENIRMKKLPLDKHLVWGMGGKSLTINQVVDIMLDIRGSGGDWKMALEHVPKRKLNRDFHPYPDQIKEREEYDDASFQYRQPSRFERKSPVLEDFELHNRRKGFRGYDTGSGYINRTERYQVRFNEGNSNYKNRSTKSNLSARDLLED